MREWRLTRFLDEMSRSLLRQAPATWEPQLLSARARGRTSFVVPGVFRSRSGLRLFSCETTWCMTGDLGQLRAKMQAALGKSAFMPGTSTSSWTSDSDSKWSESTATVRPARRAINWNNWALIAIPVLFLCVVAFYFIVIDVTFVSNLLDQKENETEPETTTFATSPFAKEVNVGLLETRTTYRPISTTTRRSTRLNVVTTESSDGTTFRSTRTYSTVTRRRPELKAKNSSTVFLLKNGEKGPEFVLESGKTSDDALKILTPPNLSRTKPKVYEEPPRRRKVTTTPTPLPEHGFKEAKRVNELLGKDRNHASTKLIEVEATTTKEDVLKVRKGPSILEELFAAEVAKGGIFGSNEKEESVRIDVKEQEVVVAPVKPLTTPRGFHYSPTVPLVARLQAERAQEVTEQYNATLPDGGCFSPRIPFCEGLLPYDMVQLPVLPHVSSVRELDAMMPYFQLILQSGCSSRAKEFICAVLEPECTTTGKIPAPCKVNCKVVAQDCKDFILETLPLSRIFDCRRYPNWDENQECLNLAKGTCYHGEYQCPDGSCIPQKWVCDGVHDCPGSKPAADEQSCSGCANHEFRCIIDGKCVPKTWQCDGHSDCADNSDELAC